jgi:hypothetical protein
MVCIGPRKKEKKNLLSPDDANTTSRGLKKSSTSKLKNSKTSTSLAPSIASTKKAPGRTSLESTTTKTGIRPPSRNSLLTTGRTPSPVHRSTSPHKPPSSSRPSSMVSVKSNNTVASSIRPPSNAASRTPSNVSTTKRFPITEMKEEVKDLKAKVSLVIQLT